MAPQLKITYPWNVQKHPGHGSQDVHGIRYHGGSPGKAKETAARLSGEAKTKFLKRYKAKRTLANKMVANTMGLTPTKLRQLEKVAPSKARKVRREAVERLKVELDTLESTQRYMQNVVADIKKRQAEGRKVPRRMQEEAERYDYAGQGKKQVAAMIRDTKTAIEYGEPTAANEGKTGLWGKTPWPGFND